MLRLCGRRSQEIDLLQPSMPPQVWAGVRDKVIRLLNKRVHGRFRHVCEPLLNKDAGRHAIAVSYGAKWNAIMSKLSFRIFILLSITCCACEVGFASQSGRSIRQIVSELRRYQSTSGDEVDVPPVVSENLTALKHGLRDLIVETVTAPETVTSEPGILAAKVVDRLESEDVPVGEEGGFGTIEGIELRRPNEYPDWLVATTSLGIPYGLDVSLYVFEKNGSAWKHALTVESNGYKTIRDAQGWLEYHVAPLLAGMQPYLVTSEISPNDVSVWQALRLKVLRVGATPDSPSILATRTLGYCLDEPYYLSVRAAGFGLIYIGNPVDRELAGWRGIHYLEYAVSPTRASIVRETAIDPYNLIRNWANENWTKASRLVDAPARETARAWHERFRTSRWACGLGQIHLSHRIQAGHDQLLAEAGCEEGENKSASAYVLFAARGDGFHIASVSDSMIPAENQGYTVYFAKSPGLTDPISETVVHPKLPPGTPPDIPGPVKLRLQITVNEDGTVGSVSVPDWPNDRFKIVVPAIQAVRKWKYKPGTMDGKPVKISIEVEVVFER